MQLLTYSAVSFGEYLAVTNQVDFASVWQELLVALGIVVINSFLLPLTKWLFTKIKNAIKKHQKTPENDGELADILLKGVEDTQDKVDKALTKLSNKGDNNGTRNKEK